MEDDLFKAVESHLDDQQFRRKIMLFQRLDNALKPLLENLEEIKPKTDEEFSAYKTFIQAARILLLEMESYFPPNTYNTLAGRINIFEDRMARHMRESLAPSESDAEEESGLD